MSSDQGLEYTPSPPPISDTYLSQYVFDEFLRVAGVLRGATILQLQELNVAPTKPQTGMIALADGTNWDPGSGAGFYGYRGGGWVLLG